jgi:hypothetical protein
MFKFPYLILLILFCSACSSNDAEKANAEIWVGNWQMVGYDDTEVTGNDTLVFMKLNADKTIEYKTQTRAGEILMNDIGKYKLNDQHSVLSIYEADKLMVEYFIRKVDEDSLIFQSDTFSIKWKRIE